MPHETLRKFRPSASSETKFHSPLGVFAGTHYFLGAGIQLPTGKPRGSDFMDVTAEIYEEDSEKGRDAACHNLVKR
jgi:hypothetical protein